eukprot:2081480-Pleurochrysis_carterae.AAC.1
MLNVAFQSQAASAWPRNCASAISFKSSMRDENSVHICRRRPSLGSFLAKGWPYLMAAPSRFSTQSLRVTTSTAALAGRYACAWIELKFYQNSPKDGFL